MKLTTIALGWCADFECPGGDCGLTCCSGEWKIILTDEEIERYRNLDHEFRDEILAAIDMETKMMKSGANGKCALLDENGYCKKVVQCGPDILSTTCKTFPRASKVYGKLAEHKVEIVCPLVAERLFDRKPIDFFELEGYGDPVPLADPKLYECLSIVRTALVEIMQFEPGSYTHGKMFILAQVMGAVKTLVQEGNLTYDTANAVLDKYCNPDVVGPLFIQCESVAEMLDIKNQKIRETLAVLWRTRVVEAVLYYYKDTFPYVEEYIKRWLAHGDNLAADLPGYIAFMRENHPMFMEQYLVYSLFDNWICLEPERFGEMMSIRILEGLLISLCNMAIWREETEAGTTAEALQKKMSVSIAAIDRRIFHSSELRDELMKVYNQIAELDLINVMLILLA